MDIEGYARRALLKGEDEKELVERLSERIMEVKGDRTSQEEAARLSRAVLLEVKNALRAKGQLFDYAPSGVSMGEFGVGSRGAGDFHVHSQLADVIGSTGAVVDATHMDDSGVVKAGQYYISLTVDGMHSRLSEFPFLAGFHVARATLRDVYVMGARPVAAFSDIHVADDGDISKVFDHVAGISAVCELVDVPYITGSTLRIGGDMVIGERMTGGVGAVGISESITPRRAARAGDVVMMTEGAGGGTIATTAIYNGMPEVVEQTINLSFLRAADALVKSKLVRSVHAMTDVTNGGIRGDAEEICATSGLGMVLDEQKMRNMVNPPVLKMLEELEIDYLGVSLDALLLIVPASIVSDMEGLMDDVGVRVSTVGMMDEGYGPRLLKEGNEVEFSPKFRESAYTPIKKTVGEGAPADSQSLKEKVDEAARAAIAKKQDVIEQLKR
ncbi:MAG: AIR synthase-related protein [Methermicoccaceae archaeon]